MIRFNCSSPKFGLKLIKSCRKNPLAVDLFKTGFQPRRGVVSLPFQLRHHSRFATISAAETSKGASRITARSSGGRRSNENNYSSLGGFTNAGSTWVPLRIPPHHNAILDLEGREVFDPDVSPCDVRLRRRHQLTEDFRSVPSAHSHKDNPLSCMAVEPFQIGSRIQLVKPRLYSDGSNPTVRKVAIVREWKLHRKRMCVRLSQSVLQSLKFHSTGSPAPEDGAVQSVHP